MKNKKVITVTITALVILAVALTSTQFVSARTPTPNSNAPPCITCNTGSNAPPCWSNSAKLGTCGTCCADCLSNQVGPCWK